MLFNTGGVVLLENFIREVESLRDVVSRGDTKTIRSQTLKNRTKLVVRKYFRDVRAYLSEAEIEPKSISQLDDVFQNLNTLASITSKKVSYVLEFSSVEKTLREVDIECQKFEGALARSAQSTSEIEKKIINTINGMVPTAGLSYQQAVLDIKAQNSKISYRGTANDLREALREIVDYMAPDDKVMAVPGYKHEDKCYTPTQKQKVRFILKSRGLSDSALKSPINATEVAEEIVSSFGRSVFQRTNLAAHISSAKSEISRLKMYIDVLFCEILEIDLNQ